jgi:predicted SnoaL-like aldol condensation-catalyzing enzyme
MRYQYMHDPQKPQRASPSVQFQLAAQIGQKAFMYYFEPELFSSLPESSTPFVLETVDGKKFGVTYDATTKAYAFTVGKSE